MGQKKTNIGAMGTVSIDATGEHAEGRSGNNPRVEDTAEVLPTLATPHLLFHTLGEFLLRRLQSQAVRRNLSSPGEHGFEVVVLVLLHAGTQRKAGQKQVTFTTSMQQESGDKYGNTFTT